MSHTLRKHLDNVGMLGFQDESGMMSDFGQREMAKQAAGAKSGCVRRPPRVGRQRDILFFSLSLLSRRWVYGYGQVSLSGWFVGHAETSENFLSFGEACFGAPFFCILGAPFFLHLVSLLFCVQLGVVDACCFWLVAVRDDLGDKLARFVRSC